MASFYSDAFLYKQPLSTHSTTLSLPSRPKIHLRRQRKQLPIVQLGDRKKHKPRRGFFLARLLRRVRLRWLRLQYACILRRLKLYYRSLIKDMVEASASVEVHQQRVFMESSLGRPGIGISLSNYCGAPLV